MVLSNKLIATLSVLIVINLAIISYILLDYTPPETPVYVEGKRFIPNPPKETFAQIIARGMPQVMGVSTVFMPSPTPAPALSKKTYKIAAIGDSMIETMGPNLDYLLKVLQKKYPGTDFQMYNYGIGGEKVNEGLARLNKPFEDIGRHYPSLPDLHPDILIVGSYAYNPFNDYNPTVYRNNLAEFVNEARLLAGKTYMLAEIAPLENGFGVGPGGVNWPESLADKQTAEIEEQMGKVFEVGKSLTVPVIDVYDRSRVPDSIYGQQKYVSGYDGIHPSGDGEILMAQAIMDNLELK